MMQAALLRSLGPLACLLLKASPLLAQSAEPLPFDPRTTSDKAPWLSARAAGMGETLSPIANGPEAAYYNPAGIGGLFQKPRQDSISELYVPYLGGSFNSSSMSLYQKLQGGQDIGDPEVATELLRAYEGEHPYARVSVAPSLTFSRMLVAYSYDVRAASTPHGLDSDALDVDYRVQSGPLLGFSLASRNQNFYLGVSAAYVERREVIGSFPLVTVSSRSLRSEAFSAAEKTYHGTPVHLGAIWHIPLRWRPSFSLVAKNLLGTSYRGTDANVATYKDPENLTLGFALGPSLGSWGMLNWIFEIDELIQPAAQFSDKLRTAAEITYGNAFGSRAGLALRAGYRREGPSFGCGINLGMIGIQLASSSEDIGVGGSRVIERRSVVNLGINIAD